MAVAGISVLSLVRVVVWRLGGPRGRRGMMGMDTGGAGAREIEQLREEVEQLRAELSDVHTRLAQVDELHNRVDFAERMLAQVREGHALPGPR